jgi:hypothetical protein
MLIMEKLKVKALKANVVKENAALTKKRQKVSVAAIKKLKQKASVAAIKKPQQKVSAAKVNVAVISNNSPLAVVSVVGV